GLVRRVANATKALLTSAPEWLPEAARVLDSPDGLHVVAPATCVCSAWQGMRALRQGPVRKALACETGEWSHSDRYLAAITDCRALLFAGSVYDERFAEHLRQLRGAFVSVGPTPGRERVPGAELTVRYPGDTDPAVRLLTEPLLAELLSSHWWPAAGRAWCGRARPHAEERIQEAYRSAYTPGSSTNSPWEPLWTMRPASKTRTRSAASAVDRRWAMATEVRPRVSRSKARWMRVSVCGS